MRVLPVISDHIPALSALAQKTFIDSFGHLYRPQDLSTFLNQSYSPEILSTHAADPDQLWQMVWSDDRPVGYIHAGPVGLPHVCADPATQGEIKRLYVDNSYQGKGLGTQLLTLGLDYLSARYDNAPQWIGVWSENHRAQTLYQSYGFEKIGTYGFQVGQTTDHEFIFRKILSPRP